MPGGHWPSRILKYRSCLPFPWWCECARVAAVVHKTAKVEWLVVRILLVSRFFGPTGTQLYSVLFFAGGGVCV